MKTMYIPRFSLTCKKDKKEEKNLYEQNIICSYLYQLCKLKNGIFIKLLFEFNQINKHNFSRCIEKIWPLEGTQVHKHMRI